MYILNSLIRYLGQTATKIYLEYTAVHVLKNNREITLMTTRKNRMNQKNIKVTKLNMRVQTMLLSSVNIYFFHTFCYHM